MLFNIVDSEKKLITGLLAPIETANLICKLISGGDLAKAASYWDNNKYVVKGDRCLLMHRHKDFYYTASFILKPEFGDCHPHVSKTVQGTLITSKINEEVVYFIRSFMGR